MGTTATKEIAFQNVMTTKTYDIRRYPGRVVAEFVPRGNKSENFDECLQELLRYLGVGLKPMNELNKSHHLVNPVMVNINSHKDNIPLQVASEEMHEEGKGPQPEEKAEATAKESQGTTPTLACEPGHVSIFLPEEYTDVTTAPVPYDKRIELKQVPIRYVATRPFYGRFSKKRTAKEAAALFHELVTEGLVPAELSNGHSVYDVAQYHVVGSQTMGFMRRNEVWVTLADSAALRALLEPKPAAAEVTAEKASNEAAFAAASGSASEGETNVKEGEEDVAVEDAAQVEKMEE